MTIEQFKEFEIKLKEAGYRRYEGPITNNDYYYAKGFEYYEDEDGEKYPRYQVIYSVWDYTNYPQVSASNKIGINARVIIHGNNRTDLVLTRSEFNIENIEYIAKKFFAWTLSFIGEDL